MDLLSELHALIAPTGIGDLFEGNRLLDVSAELGLRFVFEHGDREVSIEVDPVTEGRRHAASSRYFTFAYRLGDRANPLDGDVGRALCERVAARVAMNEQSMVDRLRAAESPAAGETRIREVTGERLLERGGSLAERYWTLSPYVGCLIGCRFCYAPSRLDPLRRMVGLAPLPWGSWVDVRVDAAAVLARELRTLPPLPIKLCPIVSDPYHAIEKRLRITRQCLEVLREAPREVLVLTRSATIVEDAPLLASIPRAFAGVSLPTIDDDVRRHFEPRASSVGDRLAALETLRAAGVRTFAIVQPMFPGSVDALADALSARVESVRIDVLHGTFGAARDFEAYPEVADPAWQSARAGELATALAVRGVKLWPGELPP